MAAVLAGEDVAVAYLETLLGASASVPAEEDLHVHILLEFDVELGVCLE